MSDENLELRGNVYWLVVSVKGRRYRESLHTSDVKSARRFRDARVKEIKGEVHHGERSRSWKEAVTAWITHSQDQIAPSSLKRYHVSFKQCEPYLSHLSIDKVDGKALHALMDARRQAGAKAATVRRDLTAISRVLEYAEAKDWREGNPTLSKRKLLKEKRDPIELPTEAAIAEILAASSERFAAMVVAARLSGCRQNELVTCTWEKFNPKAKTQGVVGKGNKARTITLSEPALAHWQAQQPVEGSDLIFCQANGEPFTAAASDYAHYRRKALLGNKAHRRFRFHDLRHLFAVEALRDGMSIYTLSKHLGHTSVQTTEIYLNFLTPTEQEAARQGVSVVVPAVEDATKHIPQKQPRLPVDSDAEIWQVLEI